MVLMAVSLLFQALVTSTPGANRSRQVPKLEKGARESAPVEAPTVIAAGVRAGEKKQASKLLLPAATAYTTPEFTELVTASSSDCAAPPPRLMLATAGSTRLAVTQSIPAI